MKIICDVCEVAAARLFCAADEAALCLRCDEKVVEIPFIFFHHFPSTRRRRSSHQRSRERKDQNQCLYKKWKYVLNVVLWLSGFFLLFSLFCRCSYSMTASHAHYVQAGMCQKHPWMWFCFAEEFQTNSHCKILLFVCLFRRLALCDILMLNKIFLLEKID